MKRSFDRKYDHEISVNGYFKELKVDSRSEQPEQPVLQLFIADLHDRRLEVGADDRMIVIRNTPHHIRNALPIKAAEFANAEMYSPTSCGLCAFTLNSTHSVSLVKLHSSHTRAY